MFAAALCVLQVAQLIQATKAKGKTVQLIQAIKAKGKTVLLLVI